MKQLMTFPNVKLAITVPRAGIRQLAALFIVFKDRSSNRGPGVCPMENL